MKTALITGVSTKIGLGYEIAKQLGQEGFHVIIAARKFEQADSIAAELNTQGIKASAVCIDLLDRASITEAVKKVKRDHQTLDVLINNAALMLDGSATAFEKNLDEFNIEFETNVTGTWAVTQYFYPLIVASGHGRIVNVSSGAGSYGDLDFGIINFPGPALNMMGDYPLTPYAITKLALNGLTVKMSKDFRRDNVLVNAICPGFTATRPGLAAYGARPVSESAKGIVWAATLADNGPTGQFFRDGKPLPW
ncbi:short chain dehydrogenase [Pustulibacterium marinum]|uniref:Short chain dehydrogenase n=1 Tax=Pustulibacterium marinum TaxID=1224947 RepID=A0A1I7I9L3_9FLAO|nr:SDR family NAD(P)-dependent oxidoreductase [Pustulibacterium marinum]SFU69598.1 short chain dehydrogenase [Pustulibacterium marinum]